MDPTLQNLREKRRMETDSQERAKITKDIWKVSRKKLREYRTIKAKECLEKFADFKNMEYSHKYPIERSSGAKPDELKCAALLEQVYSTDNPSEYASSCHVPAFTEHELSVVLYSMKKRRVVISPMFVLRCSSMQMKTREHYYWDI